MPRKESGAVPEGNGPISQDAGKIITWEELQRVVKEMGGGDLKEIRKDLKSMDQRLIRLEHDARQPRLAIKADGQADTKPRERTESDTTAVQAMHGDSCSANRVDPDPMCSTSFGHDCTGPPALPCSREDVPVDNGAAAPKSFISPLEMRSPTAAGGLLPTGEPLRQRRPPSTSHLFGSTQPRRHAHGLRFYSSRTTAASSGRIIFLPPPPARGSSR